MARAIRKYADFVAHIAQRGRGQRILGDKDARRGIELMWQMRRQWIRPASEWTGVSRRVADKRKILAMLANHLFCQYEVPYFMGEAWLTRNTLHIDWFLHLGRGKNIRTAAELPFALTKKEAHFFTQAPKKTSIERAFRYAQLMALGATSRLYAELINSPMGTDYKHHDFWTEVIHFFLRQKMLPMYQVRPIVDFVYAQRLGDNGSHTFSMKGRSLKAVVRQMELWHETLYLDQRQLLYDIDTKWEGVGLDDWEYFGQEGAYVIREITNYKDLLKEGKIMGHCVASYIHKILEEHTTIWSLKCLDGSHEIHTLTIELVYDEVRQVRGERNRLPTIDEERVVEAWAKAHYLTVERF